MKLLFSLIPALLSPQAGGKRNMHVVMAFTLFTTFLVFLFSMLFHFIMEYEGKDYSFITGLYWTLTVMSTLGFGDITFESDLGKLFSIVVLMTGIMLIMVLMPFMFIRFVYQPWIDAYNSRRKPRELPEGTSGHTILVGENALTLNIAQKLRQYKFPYALLVPPDSRDALDLYDNHYDIVTGEFDDANTYRNLRVDKAALVAAFCDDLKNTNIASTVREAAPSTLLAASAENLEAMNILQLAGCDLVYSFEQMLGRSLARRVYGTRAQSNIIARFGTLCIAEAPVVHTEFIGLTLMECGLRERFGLNVVGLWEGNTYLPARPDSRIEKSSILLLAGTANQLSAYDRKAEKRVTDTAPVLILGGGKVGMSAAEALDRRGVPYHLVEKNARLVDTEDPRYIIGNAGDFEVLRRAGILETPSVIITTHNDDLNIYLTIYCRKLRPDMQILSRSTLDRNVASLYNAGANLVMSHASMAASTIINLLSPGRMTILTEGMLIFRVVAPPSLIGLSLKESHIRERTECNVVALRHGQELSVPPDPQVPIQKGTELILIGSAEAEHRFMSAFPGNY